MKMRPQRGSTCRPCLPRRPFRPLGYGNGKKESTTFAGWSNCYLGPAVKGLHKVLAGSNDPYGETLHSLLSLVKAKVLSVDRFVSVVGSFVALQFLPLALEKSHSTALRLVLRPKSLHFFDMNPQQAKNLRPSMENHPKSFETFIEFHCRCFGRRCSVSSSASPKTPQEYISRVFARLPTFVKYLIEDFKAKKQIEK